MGSWKSGSMGLERMSVEQLKAVKEQTDMEVNLLQDSLTNIRNATTRLEIASSALNDLSVRPPANQILVPLTASLYVPATLHDSTHVLIDVGTGYFIEVLRIGESFVQFVSCSSIVIVMRKQKTMDEGKDYCDRKINLLKSNFDQLVEVASKKKNVADEAGVILQAKMKQLASSS
ncbi:hypothetical protein ACSQ67_013537 [Phaseolus vulgaris]